MEKVCSCARMVLNTMVHAKMGTTHSSSFTCSTSAGVHRRHGLSFVPADDPPVLSGAFTQALSKNLDLE
jgi:hypothetical protein